MNTKRSFQVAILGVPTTAKAEAFAKSLRSEPNYHVISPTPDLNASGELRPDRLLEMALDERQTALCVLLLSNQYFHHLSAGGQAEKAALFEKVERKPDFFFPILLAKDTIVPGWMRFIWENLEAIPIESILDNIRARIVSTSKTSPLFSHPQILPILRSIFGQDVQALGDPELLVSRRIAYQLFLAASRLYQSKTMIVYIHSGADVVAVRKHILEKITSTVEKLPRTVILESYPTLDRSNLLKDVKTLFSVNSVHFLDELIFSDICQFTPPQRKEDSTVDTFISPAYSIAGKEEKSSAETHLLSWFTGDAVGDSIATLSGPGGIGKTTIARKLVNLLNTDKKRLAILLDAKDLLRALQQNRDLFDIFNIYSIFRIFARDTEQSELNEEKFRWAFDAGRLPIIIDGFDEFIPRLNQTNAADRLLDSIIRFTQDMRKGRVLITCRDLFWAETNVARPIKSIELLPFSGPQMLSFFEKRLDDFTVRKRAERIAKKIGIEENIRLAPSIVELIAIMAERQQDDIVEFDIEAIPFDLRKEPVDLIALNLCRREKRKFQQAALDVDQQFTFLVEFALRYRGDLPEAGFRAAVEDSVGQKLPHTAIDTLRSHPILKTDEVAFRYDFFEDFFLMLGLQEGLSGRRDSFLSRDELFYVGENCKFSSNLLRDLATRMQQLTPDAEAVLQLAVAHAISLFHSHSIDEPQLRTMLGGITGIGLRVLIDRQNNVDDQTTFLKRLYDPQGEGVLRYVTLIGVNLPNKTIRFRFDGLTIIDGYFYDYDDFLKCSFDEKTNFVHARVEGGTFPPNVKTEATTENFTSDCILDPIYWESIASMTDRKQRKQSNRADILAAFFTDFRTRGRLFGHRQRETIRANFPRGYALSGDQFIREMLRLGVINENPSDANEVRIATDLVPDVEKFVEQGFVTKRIADLLKQMNKW
jgi:hypothetical protein